MANKDACVSATWLMHLFKKKMLDVLGVILINKSIQEQIHKIADAPDKKKRH